LISTRVTQIARGTVSSQHDGEPSSFTGTFMDVPPTASQRFTVDTPAIVAQLPDLTGWVVSLRKSPSSAAFDSFGPSLLDVSVGKFDTAPVAFTESYGDPLDPGWQLVATGTYAVFRDLPVLPDGRQAYFPWSTYATEQRLLAPGDDFTLSPVSAFVTDASLDGHALDGDVPWDGHTPLSFHVGVPAGESGFTADVLWIPAGKNETQLWTRLRSQTADVELPPDAFQLGFDYMIRVAVTSETESSRLTAYTVLGPFRLVQP
jgi:hypothetical protein